MKSKVSSLFAAAAFSFSGQIQVPEGYPDKSDTVISIEKEGLPAPKTQSATIDQKNMSFIPHVTVVSQGSKITLRNSDPGIHGIKAQDGPLKGLHVRMDKNLKEKSLTAETSGVSELLCDIHAQMKAYVVVVPTDFYSVSNKKGVFRFKTLPEPPFKVKVWHPILPAQDFEVATKDELSKLKTITLKTWQN